MGGARGVVRRGKRRPRRRGERLTWPRFWRGLGGFLRASGPTLAILFATLALVMSSVTLLRAGSTLRQNDDLRAHGGRAPAVVVRVEERHHSGGRGGGSYTEYWPVTEQTIDGERFTSSLRRYAVRHDGVYRAGAHVRVMYDRDHRWTVALADDAARDRIAGVVRNNWIVAGGASVVLACCVPIQVRRRRAARRRAETSGVAVRSRRRRSVRRRSVRRR